MYVRNVPVTRLAAGIVDLLYSRRPRSDICLCVGVANVYGSSVSDSESVPVRSQGKYSTSSWHVQPRLAERGVNGGLRHSPSMRPLAICCGASYGSRLPR